jgi:SAM-dependent methyltransferase
MFSPPNYSARKNFLNPRFGPHTVFLYLHRQPILDSVKAAAPLLKGKLLDVGCGNKPYASILRCEEYIGVDVESSTHTRSNVDIVYDGRTLPFQDEQFDSVLCTEVIEHSQDPQRVAHEIGRVLKYGGFALITAPMVFHHHEEPYDFQRFTRYGMECLAKQAGLKVIWIKPRGGIYSTMTALFYTTLGYSLSRRPFIDCLLWLAWPIAALLLRFESRTNKEHVVISLGWQMLVNKCQEVRILLEQPPDQLSNH